ncbi:DMT family transporter [Flavobacterium sp. NKUCC04_CG]|uniref:EamA family transporter n=1 Tax=Flavobacterium sp. NKUCC04_CG TaxID=2842121 RepID=UPI001C5AA861|nr:DMT family transporter [Flavobacterium sp. NKUCC04_CG]MBW3519397.1 DMT family transporter [Flavobacterium sp. NKUCC04_CG]
MKEKNITKGVLLIACGASSFGMLASFVKLAYRAGFTTAEVTFSQVILGLVGMFFINLFRKKQLGESAASTKDIRQLILAGTSMGFTSVLYYMAVSYIDASIAVVLLMQSVWIGVVIESIMTKTFPSKIKLVAVAIILFGTVLATNILGDKIELDYRGVFLGFLAACSFSMTMFTTNFVANHLAAPKRSFFMLIGATIIVSIFTFITQVGPNNFEFMRSFLASMTDNTSGIRDFDFTILLNWGLLLALFGTIIPPIFLNMGFPHAGVGLGSIISSIELPVSVTVAYLLLNEPVIAIQWIGILLILSAIVLMNSQLIFKKTKN